jgi:hypothetical protein
MVNIKKENYLNSETSYVVLTEFASNFYMTKTQVGLCSILSNT